MTQAGDVQGGAQSAGVMDQAKDTVQQFAGQAKEQVTQRAQSTFDQGKARAAEQLTGVAQTLRQTTEQLGKQGQVAFLVPYLERGVGQLDRLAEYVRTADAQDVARQTEDLARRQPALFLGGLFAIGLAGARFLKSSGRDMTQQRTGGYPNYGSYGSGGTSASTASTAGAGYGSGAGYGGASQASQGGSGLSGGGLYGGSSSATGTGSMGTGSTGPRSTGTTGTGSTGAGSAGAGGLDIGPTTSGLRGDI